MNIDNARKAWASYRALLFPEKQTVYSPKFEYLDKRYKPRVCAGLFRSPRIKNNDIHNVFV